MKWYLDVLVDVRECVPSKRLTTTVKHLPWYYWVLYSFRIVILGILVDLDYRWYFSKIISSRLRFFREIGSWCDLGDLWMVDG